MIETDGDDSVGSSLEGNTTIEAKQMIGEADGFDGADRTDGIDGDNSVISTNII